MLWHGAVNGGLVGLVAGLLAPWLNLRLCRCSLLVQAAWLSLIWLALLIPILLLSHYLLLGDRLSFWLHSRASFWHLLICYLMVLLINLGLRLAEYLGPTALKGLVLGYYLKPRTESRLFLFLDIQNSTALTQQLGAGQAQLLFAEFLYQVSRLIRRHGGEVQRYVGDQVMATWSYPQGVGAALAALDDLARQLPQWNLDYRAQFGTTLGYHAGLAGGPVIAKEIGAQRRSVEFFGDAVNTAARLEKLAGEQQAGLILPADLLELAPAYRPRARPLGPLSLKGLASPIALIALDLGHAG